MAARRKTRDVLVDHREAFGAELIGVTVPKAEKYTVEDSVFSMGYARRSR